MLNFNQELFRKRISLELAVPKELPKRPVFKPAEDTPKLLKIADDQEFVESAYRQILGREADDAGLTGYLEALRRHTPRRDILKRLSNSAEAKARSTESFNGHVEETTKPAMFNRLREGVVGKARQVLNQVLLSRFDAIDFRLSFLLNNISERDHLLSAKLDDSVSLLSEKLDMVLAKQATPAAPVLSARQAAVARVDGFQLAVPPQENGLTAYLEFQAGQEPGVLRRFQSMVKPGMIVVDVGAHLGRFTLQAANVLRGTGGVVHSFEPAPETYALLEGNVRDNGLLDQTILHRAAVTDRDGTAQLLVFADKSSHNTLFTPPEHRGPRLEVRSTSLDAALLTAPHVDIVNIDAPGAESLILRGMSRLIQSNPQLQILLAFTAQAAESLLVEIHACGFEINKVDPQTGVLSAVSEAELLETFSTHLHLQRRAGSRV